MIRNVVIPLEVAMMVVSYIVVSHTHTHTQELELTARAHGIPTPSLNPETQKLAHAAEQALGSYGEHLTGGRKSHDRR